jgi:epoxide hydrolase 4
MPAHLATLSAALVLPALLIACARGAGASEEGEGAAPPLVDGYADVNGVRLHYVSAGTGPLILFVHGFPEFWYAWRKQLLEFGRDHQAVAVDMRGYNLSSKPDSLDAYQVPNMVEDLRALADHFGARTFVLVAHDWGGVIAWAFAMTHPDRLEKFVAINAPHPAIFARELARNPAQQQASMYMLAFRAPGAEQMLAANNYEPLTRSVLGDLLAAGHFTAADSAEYLKAWSQPGALTGGLNYYRASRIGVSATGAPAVPSAPPTAAQLTVSVPTLVIWGERDPYLLTGNLDGLDALVPALTVRRIPDATHWIVHERPAEVNAMIREFLGTYPFASPDHPLIR